MIDLGSDRERVSAIGFQGVFGTTSTHSRLPSL